MEHQKEANIAGLLWMDEIHFAPPKQLWLLIRFPNVNTKKLYGSSLWLLRWCSNLGRVIPQKEYQQTLMFVWREFWISPPSRVIFDMPSHLRVPNPRFGRDGPGNRTKPKKNTKNNSARIRGSRAGARLRERVPGGGGGSDDAEDHLSGLRRRLSAHAPWPPAAVSASWRLSGGHPPAPPKKKTRKPKPPKPPPPPKKRRRRTGKKMGVFLVVGLPLKFYPKWGCHHEKTHLETPALASHSEHCSLCLTGWGLGARREHAVDGRNLASLGNHGKP